MKNRYVFIAPHRIVALTLLVAGISILGGCSSGMCSTPQAGDRYELIAPIYIVGAYNSLNNKTVSREAAKAYLDPIKYADRIYYAFNEQIPAGTTMTIIDSAPKVWNLPFKVKRYFVELEPDPSRGLEVILTLDRGMEGDLDGLNPKLFRKLP